MNIHALGGIQTHDPSNPTATRIKSKVLVNEGLQTELDVHLTTFYQRHALGSVTLRNDCEWLITKHMAEERPVHK
jgi:hypothetical protein